MTRVCDSCREETEARLTDNKGNDFCKQCFKEIYGTEEKDVSDRSFIEPADNDDDNDFGPKPPYDPNPTLPDFWITSRGTTIHADKFPA